MESSFSLTKQSEEQQMNANQTAHATNLTDVDIETTYTRYIEKES